MDVAQKTSPLNVKPKLCPKKAHFFRFEDEISTEIITKKFHWKTEDSRKSEDAIIFKQKVFVICYTFYQLTSSNVGFLGNEIWMETEEAKPYRIEW